MSLPSSSRGGARIRVVTLHTAEGARNKEDLYAFFDRNQNASSHVGIDADGISGQWVPDSRAAWTLRSGNPYSLNAELCAFARWSRAQWLHEGWVDGSENPRQIIRNAAAWARRECDQHNIPKRWLTIGQFRAGWSGIIDHDTYTDATGDGTHWDVGEGFPVDVFMDDLLGGSREEKQQEDDDMANATGVLEAGNHKSATIPLAGLPPYVYFYLEEGKELELHAVDFVKQTDGNRPGKASWVGGGNIKDWTVLENRPGPFNAHHVRAMQKAGAVGMRLFYSSSHDVRWYVG